MVANAAGLIPWCVSDAILSLGSCAQTWSRGWLCTAGKKLWQAEHSLLSSTTTAELLRGLPCSWWLWMIFYPRI